MRQITTVFSFFISEIPVFPFRNPGISGFKNSRIPGNPDFRFAVLCPYPRIALTTQYSLGTEGHCLRANKKVWCLISASENVIIKVLSGVAYCNTFPGKTVLPTWLTFQKHNSCWNKIVLHKICLHYLYSTITNHWLHRRWQQNVIVDISISVHTSIKKWIHSMHDIFYLWTCLLLHLSVSD